MGATQGENIALNEIGAVFERLDRELWLVTTRAGDRLGGLIATQVSRAAISPELPRLTLGLAKHHHTCALVSHSGRFALHLLRPGQIDLVWRFGLASGHQSDKYAGLSHGETSGGNPLIPGVPGWLDCRIEATLDCGDRLLFLAAVTDGRLLGKALPLTTHELYRLAPEDKRRQLEALYRRDGDLDAEAIRLWRLQRERSSETETPP